MSLLMREEEKNYPYIRTLLESKYPSSLRSLDQAIYKHPELKGGSNLNSDRYFQVWSSYPLPTPPLKVSPFPALHNTTPAALAFSSACYISLLFVPPSIPETGHLELPVPLCCRRALSAETF